jgi:Putative binding domain, N-terminal
LAVAALFAGLFFVNLTAIDWSNGEGNPTSSTSPPNDRDPHPWCGANQSIGVLTNSNTYAWNAAVTLGNSWITLNGQTSFIGNGTVNYTVDQNLSGLDRSGEIVIDGHLYNIEQFAFDPNVVCTASVTPNAIVARRQGGSINLDVRVERGIRWDIVIAERDIPWISGVRSEYSNSLQINIAPNTGRGRITFIEVAGIKIPIVQEGRSGIK